MKILVTNPPWIFGKGLKKRFGLRAGSRWSFSIPYYPFFHFRIGYNPYPGFMGYTVSYLQSQGIDARFYDAIACRHSYTTFYKNVDSFKPDIIIQETSTPSIEIDLEIAKRLHEKYEVCLVGSHASLDAQNLIQLPFVDYILKGEYEYSSLEMVKTRKKGVCESQHIKDLDDLPYPYRDKEIIHHYREYDCKKNLKFPQLWIYGSRGCAFDCSFCLWVHQIYNKKFALRKPQNILREVDDMCKKYDFKYIEFDDDTWNMGKKERLMEIADGLKEIGVPWSILCRLDITDKDSFKYFVDRGCAGIRLGVESLSQKLLDRTNKKLKVETMIDKINFLKTLDVSIKLTFMHYIPGETEEDRIIQNQKIKELGVKYQNPPCIPFPGTPYFNQILNSEFGHELKSIPYKDYDGGKIGERLKKVALRYATMNLED